MVRAAQERERARMTAFFCCCHMHGERGAQSLERELARWRDRFFWRGEFEISFQRVEVELPGPMAPCRLGNPELINAHHAAEAL